MKAIKLIAVMGENPGCCRFE